MHAARKSVVEDGLTPPTRAAPLDCAAKLRARGECCRGVLLHDRFRTHSRVTFLSWTGPPGPSGGDARSPCDLGSGAVVA